MDPRSPDVAAAELEAFAAAVAHELRTPLAALSGEVELALRRDRSQAAYREALSRIAASIGELIDLTGDLSFLGDTSAAKDIGVRAARLEQVLAAVAVRHHATQPDALRFELGATDVAVRGDEWLLTRALTLVVGHAVRHRVGGARVRLRAAPPDQRGAGAGTVDLLVDAVPGGFLAHAWQFLIAMTAEVGSARFVPGPLRLRTAERIVRDCGGSLRVGTEDGAQVVEIRLRRSAVA